MQPLAQDFASGVFGAELGGCVVAAAGSSPRESPKITRIDTMSGVPYYNYSIMGPTTQF